MLAAFVVGSTEWFSCPADDGSGLYKCSDLFNDWLSWVMLFLGRGGVFLFVLWHHPLAQLLSDTLPLLLEIGQVPFSRAATNPGLSSDEVVLFARTYDSRYLTRKWVQNLSFFLGEEAAETLETAIA